MGDKESQTQSTPPITFYMDFAPFSNKLPEVRTVEEARPWNQRKGIDLARGLDRLKGLDNLASLNEGQGFLFEPRPERVLGLTGLDTLSLMVNPNNGILALMLADAELTPGELAQEATKIDIENAHNRVAEDGRHFRYEPEVPMLRSASVFKKLVDHEQARKLVELGLLRKSAAKERLTSSGQLQNLSTYTLNEDVGGSILMLALVAAQLREIAPDMIDIFPERFYTRAPKTRSALGLSAFSSAIHTLYWMAQAPDQSFNSEELYDISGGLVGEDRAYNVRAFMSNLHFYLTSNDLIVNPDSPELFQVNQEHLAQALEWRESKPTRSGNEDANVNQVLAALHPGEVLTREILLDVIQTLYPPEADKGAALDLLRYLERYNLLERQEDGSFRVLRTQRPAYLDLPLYDPRQLKSATMLQERFAEKGGSIQDLTQALSEIHGIEPQRAYEMLIRLRRSGAIVPIIEEGKEPYTHFSRFRITQRGQRFLQLLLDGLSDPAAFSGIDPSNLSRIRGEQLVSLTGMPLRYKELLEVTYQAMAESRGLERVYLEKDRP
jgi:hypothetical protein